MPFHVREPSAELTGALEKRFRAFSAKSTKFSREIISMAADYFERDPSKSAEMNLVVTKLIFGKWTIELLTVLYAARDAGFQDLRGSLGAISARILSQKLKTLERFGIVKRRVLSTRPPRVQYRLTEKGVTIAKLGEPVFLFLGFTERLLPRIKVETGPGATPGS